MKKIILTILYLLLMPTILFAGSQEISGTDASVIAQRARVYLHDPTIWGGTQRHIWSDTMLLQWVNDGTVYLAYESECLEDIESETLVENQASYPLTSSYIAIKAVIYKGAAGTEWSLDKGDLLGKDGNKPSFGHSDDATGAPGYWTQWENGVKVHPLPDSDAAGDTIDVYLVERPTTVTATDDVLVPASLDEALVYYVAAKGFLRDGKSSKHGVFMALCDRAISKYLNKYIETMPRPEVMTK